MLLEAVLAIRLSADTLAGVANPEHIFSAIVWLVVFFYALFKSLDFNRKKRLLDDTPTSKALGVFIGEVELDGTCVCQSPLPSHVGQVASVYFSWSVSEQWCRQTLESDLLGIARTQTTTGYTVVASGSSMAGFYLQDETGYVWVEPAGAEIEARETLNREVTARSKLYYAKGPAGSIPDSTFRRTFTEHTLPVGVKLFIRGRASERPDIVAAQIKHEKNEDIYIISDRKEAEIANGMGTWSTLWNMGAGLAAFLSPLTLFAGAWPVIQVFFGFVGLVVSIIDSIFSAITFGFHEPSISFKDAKEMFSEGMAGVYPYLPQSILIGFIIYLLARTAGASWSVFNSLIGLRNRVASAYSLIDIQVKRRHDLIQNLVVCVAGFRDHEAAVQTLVASIRAQAGGGSLQALGPSILAVVERYPEITALTSFQDLSKQLIQTEDRIALARGYHNNIATFYNTRVQRFPECILAGLGRMKPEPLFEAEGFSYHPAAASVVV